jgi:hypothetical protein
MSHYVFSFISFFFICNVWMLYKRERERERERERKTEKRWRGVNCEEEMREKKKKKMRWVRGDVCVWCRRRKKKGPGYMGGG